MSGLLVSLFFFEFTRFPVQDKSQTLSSICPPPFDGTAKIENVFIFKGVLHRKFLRFSPKKQIDSCFVAEILFVQNFVHIFTKTKQLDYESSNNFRFQS